MDPKIHWKNTGLSVSYKNEPGKRWKWTVLSVAYMNDIISLYIYQFVSYKHEDSCSLLEMH